MGQWWGRYPPFFFWGRVPKSPGNSVGPVKSGAFPAHLFYVLGQGGQGLFWLFFFFFDLRGPPRKRKFISVVFPQYSNDPFFFWEHFFFFFSPAGPRPAVGCFLPVSWFGPWKPPFFFVFFPFPPPPDVTSLFERPRKTLFFFSLSFSGVSPHTRLVFFFFY